MSASSPVRAIRRPRFSLDTWAIIAASVLVVAVVVGTLPRVPW
jgi:hypothetical protein